MNPKLFLSLLLQCVTLCSCTMEKQAEQPVLTIESIAIGMSKAKPHPMLREDDLVIPARITLKNPANKPINVSFASLTAVVLRAQFQGADGEIWKLLPAQSPHFRNVKITVNPDTAESVSLFLPTSNPAFECLDKGALPEIPPRLKFNISDAVFLYQDPRTSHEIQSIKVMGAGFVSIE